MKKLGFHAAHEEKQAAIGRVLVCGLIFCVLLSTLSVGAAASEVVTFPDANLEAAVRQALNKPSGDITADDMATLTHLSNARPISDLSGLEYAVNLQELHLNYCHQISDLSPLASLTNLVNLDLANNQFSDIGPLAGLTNLRELKLRYNQISDLDPLAGLTNLESLDLYYNRISDIGPLAGLTNLRELDLGSNQVSNIGPLAGLTNIQLLDLGFKNQISDIGPLAGLTNLQSLDLFGNQISDIGPLAGLTNLQSLDLCHNRISDIGTLAGLTNLQYLQLYSNQISDIGPLAGLTNLQYLQLYNNSISDIGPLVANSGLGSTDIVYLHYNYLDLTPGSTAMNDIQTLQDRGVGVTYTPQHQVTTYTLDLAVNPEGGGTVIGAGSYPAGETVSVTATPNDGYTFVGWTDEAGNTVSTEASFGYTMPEGEATLTANFDAITYTLDLMVNPEGSGTVTGAGIYAAGETVSLTATAAEGYIFAGWTDGAGATVSTEASFDYTMPEGDGTLTANFEAITYTLDLAVNPEGSGTVTGAGTYAAGEAVSVTATPEDGYTFTGWTDGAGNPVSTEASFDYTMPEGDTTLTANFDAITYTLDLAVNPEGGGTVTGSGTYATGEIVSVTATPEDGYTFTGWTDGAGNTVSTEASFDYTMPQDDATLTANFDAITYTLDLTVNPEGGGTVTGTGNYNAGSTVSVTATPNDGYTFAGWIDGPGDIVSTSASFDYTMPEGDTTLTANFDAVTYTLDLTVNPEGSGTVTGAGSYNAGSTASLAATAAEGYTFVGWTDGAGNTVSTSATFDYTMPEGDATLTANFKTNFEKQFEVQWLPPVTNEKFVLQDGTTLPLKFRLVDETGAVVRGVQEGISLRIEGVKTWELGNGGSALRFNNGQYTANFDTRDYDNLGSELTATVRDADGSELGSIAFEVSPKKGAGGGNGKPN